MHWLLNVGRSLLVMTTDWNAVRVMGAIIKKSVRIRAKGRWYLAGKRTRTAILVEKEEFVVKITLHIFHAGWAFILVFLFGGRSLPVEL
jgi:hypothetical protein